MWGPRGRRRALVLLLAATLAVTAACSDDPEESSSGADTPAGPESSTDTAEQPAHEVDGSWRSVVAPASCRCSDGSPFNFWVREGDPERVVFFLEGGGACFSAETCGPARPTFTRNLTDGTGGGSATEPPDAEGIFAVDADDNPLADHSIVYVPYCTGDLHLGTLTRDYGDGVVVHHNGLVNASTALAATAAMFPDAQEVVVAGASAGSAGAPLYAGLAHDVLPDAQVRVLADGSAAYPDDEAITAAIGELWGSHTDLPPWPAAEGVPTSRWTLPGLFVQAGRHAPDIAWATINSAYDEIQARFSSMIGFDDDLLTMIDANTATIEEQGVELVSWVNAGTMHTVLTRPEFYDTEVDGTLLHEWVADFLAGADVPDVHCTDCE